LWHLLDGLPCITRHVWCHSLPNNYNNIFLCQFQTNIWASQLVTITESAHRIYMHIGQYSYFIEDNLICLIFHKNFHSTFIIQVDTFTFVTPCIDVVGYQRFRGPCCLCLQGKVHSAGNMT
jgi:hypothetical protein